MSSKSVIQSNETFSPKVTIRVVFLALLLDILAFTIILPLFPRLLQEYQIREQGDESTLLSWFLRQIHLFRNTIGGGGTNPKWDLVLLGGALGSLYSFLQFVASPFIGAISDRYGRRNTLLVTMIGNILSTLLWLFAKSFGWFVLARIVGGLSEGNVQLSIAIMSDITTQKTRSEGLALVGIAFAISFTIGPALGAFFASKDLAKLFPQFVEWGLNPYSMPAFVALILLSVETFYLYTSLPETAYISHEKSSQQEEKFITKNQLQNTLSISTRKSNLKILNWIHFLYLFFFSGMEFTLTFLTFDLFDFTNMQNGKLLGYIGILSALIQGSYRREAYNVGEKLLVVLGIVSCSIALAVIAFLTGLSNGITWLYVGATFLAFTSATVVNCLTSIASMQCDDERQLENENSEGSNNVAQNNNIIPKGQALGTFRSFGQLGRASGPIAACGLYWMAGSKICYASGSLAMLIIFIIVNFKVPSVQKKLKSE
ncbi:major facilitator superfamily domain-containing protein [Glomus cerebriforme]|uniref:Major facilitator superfamily domain-containing protein n=1 Tax=Glomus cerebriforme TaxID=658196 RepID=A0A397TLA6_9GLOM|nr:major facilitator superfamily domain-containing protein [Glomus cerebriforme]